MLRFQLSKAFPGVETTELLYLLGEDHRIVDVSGLQAEIARD